MKTILYLTLTLLTFVPLAFVSNGFAQDASPKYVVRLIYFIPNDIDPIPDIDTQLDAMIKEVQSLFAEQMESHGFGRQTIAFETDVKGDAVVHHLNGEFADEYYHFDTIGKVWKETLKVFDTSKDIYLFIIDTRAVNITSGNREAGGFGSADGFGRGRAFISAHQFSTTKVVDTVAGVTVAAHELGHAFGLMHDGRTKVKSLPNSYTSDIMLTSLCAAEWLDVSPFFNTDKISVNEPTVVQMLPPVASPPNGVSLRFEVTDPDGLHQAQLFPAGAYSITDCKRLNGENVTVEFVTTRIAYFINSYVTLRVVDTKGNFTGQTFPIDITHLLAPSKNVLIPDQNLATIVEKALNLTPADAITQRDMQRLTKIYYNNPMHDSLIANLAGIEHATGLESILLQRNQIRDITPLTTLKNLQTLNLGGNPISDFTPLSEMTQLRWLYLPETNFNDLNLLSEFAQLNTLFLDNNDIDDITPLARLVTSDHISLNGNQIRDITPLTKVINLRQLSLSRNPISDFTPLSEMTRLTWLDLSQSNFADLNLLTGHTLLSALYIGNNAIRDITPLAQLNSLYYLNANNNSIRDISDLAALSGLRHLHLSDNQISDIQPLTKLTNLSTLNLDNNEISDVSPLVGLANLEVLYLVGNPIEDREPLLELLQKNSGIKIYLKSHNKPLPVTLSRFQAEHTDTGVVLKWITESEIDNAGFYIYRSQTRDGEFKVVNPTLIQGAGTTSERHTYTWKDTTAKPNVAYYYRIEDISHAGVRKQLATVRMKGFVSAKGKLTTSWADLKMY